MDKMYLHIGNNKIIRAKDVIGIFDADTATVSKTTRAYLSEKEKKGLLTTATDEVPRAFVLYGDKKRRKYMFFAFVCKNSCKQKRKIQLK